MTAAARIFVLTRDDNDREEWGDPVLVMYGHWSPHVALMWMFLNDEPLPGTYRCESAGATATLGWDGDKVVVA